METQMDYQQYWEQFLPLFPKGWILIDYDIDAEALYGDGKLVGKTLTLTHLHANLIKNAVVAGRMDSKFMENML
jgi:hypothetical protein